MDLPARRWLLHQEPESQPRSPALSGPRHQPDCAGVRRPPRGHCDHRGGQSNHPRGGEKNPRPLGAIEVSNRKLRLLLRGRQLCAAEKCGCPRAEKVADRTRNIAVAGTSRCDVPAPFRSGTNAWTRTTAVAHSGELLASGYSAALLSVTFNTEDLPGGRTVLFLATLPDSTQTICRYSSSPKSGICCALAGPGFHTTVEADPLFSTRSLRRSRGSRTSTGAVVSR